MTRRGGRAAELMRQRDQELANGHVQADPPAAPPAEPPEPTDEELRQASEHDRRLREQYGVGDAADTAPAVIPPPANTQAAGWRFAPIPSDQFAAGDYRLTWLVNGLLVQGQPAVLGGPQKALKTTLAVDLAVSLASGTPFLGTFNTGPPARVVVLSGESGAATLQETARRVCKAKEVDLAVLPLGWQLDLPKLGSPDALEALRAGLGAGGYQVAVIDPLYLCLLDGRADLQASNLYQVGPLLRAAAACLRADCTPVLVHHTNRPAARSNDPLQLTDLAFAGISEFARQWLLVNRREPFAAGETDRLWLSAGGSAGQSGLFAVDVDQGALGDDFTGRIWDVQVRPPHEEQERRRASRDRLKREGEQQREQEDDRRLLESLDALAHDGTGASLRQVRDHAGMSDTRATQAVGRLRGLGIVEDVPGFRATIGNGGGRPARGIRRVRDGN